MPKSGAQERSAEAGDRQSCCEQSERFEAFASLPLPVNVPQIQPQGELIQRKRRAYSIRHRHRPPGPCSRATRARSRFQQPAVTGEEQEQNPPNQMMDMPAAHLDVMERANVVVDQKGQRAHYRDGNEEAEGGPEEPFARRLWKLIAIEGSQTARSQQAADPQQHQ